MAFKYGTTSKPIKGTKFTDALKEVKQDFYQNVNEWRQGAVKAIEGSVTGTDKFFTELDDAMALLQGDAQQMAVYDSFFVDKATQEDFSNAVRQLSGTLNIKTTYEVDHKTMAPINQRLSLLIVSMVDMINTVEAGQASGVPARDLQTTMSGLAPTARRVGEGAGVRKMIAGLKKTVDRLRRVRAMGEVIERLYNSNQQITPKSLLEGLESLKDDKGKVDITFAKDKDVGLGPDGELAKFAVTVKSKHGEKSKWQQIQGALRTGILKGPKAMGAISLDDSMKDMLKDALQVLVKADLTNITGSKSISDTLGKQIGDTFKGKKTRKVKSRSRTNLSSTGNIRKPKGKNIAAKASLREIYSISRLAQVRTSRENNSVGIEKTKSADIQQELNKLRTLINRRLPAQVRRNMGRPALINRTGRFSNSVELQSLRPAGKTIVGTYSYQMNPYETFENTGEKQWPVGYNPKPLITKSIRDLALEYTNQKLTLRRG